MTLRILAILLLLTAVSDLAPAVPLPAGSYWGGQPPNAHPPAIPQGKAIKLGAPNQLLSRTVEKVTFRNFRGEVERRVYRLAADKQLLFTFQVRNYSAPGVVVDQVGLSVPRLGTRSIDADYVIDLFRSLAPTVKPVWATRSGNGQEMIFDFGGALRVIAGRSTKFTYFTTNSLRPVSGGKLTLYLSEPGVGYGTSVKFSQPQ